MTNIVINVIDRCGGERRIDWTPDQSLMECLRDNDLPVLASCGGTASCSTCHVYLAPGVVASLGGRSEDEIELLEENEWFRNLVSRLSCQIGFDQSLSDIVVELAPEE